MIRHVPRTVVLALAFVALAACTRRAPVDMTAVRAEVGARPVVLLSVAWCGYCRKLRADLKQWRVAFDEFDVEDSAKGSRAYRLLRGAGVPILLVNEKPIHGYMPQRAHELLAAASLLRDDGTH